MAESPIGNVSDTAFWIAHYRAVETARTNALFRDPFAALLAGQRGKQITAAMPGSALTGWSVVIRTCIIDNYIRQAIAESIDVVLNLGAGLDTRPYRRDLPVSLTWFEADYPEVIQHKEVCLAGETPRCRLQRMKLDLADRNKRRALFTQVNEQATKVLILTEGVVPYLSTEEVGLLADDLRTLDKACYWIVDYFAPQVLKYGQRYMKRKMPNATFRFKPADWFAFFQTHGWRAKDIRYLAKESAALHRPIPLPLAARLYVTVRRVFAGEAARNKFRNNLGYVLLEPRRTGCEKYRCELITEESKC